MLNIDNLISQNKNSIIDEFYIRNQEKEASITDEFYTIYNQVRIKLFKTLKDNNPEIDEIILFEKAQKLMDRFIFICFCEDKLLLPANTFNNVLNGAKQSFDPSLTNSMDTT